MMTDYPNGCGFGQAGLPLICVNDIGYGEGNVPTHFGYGRGDGYEAGIGNSKGAGRGIANGFGDFFGNGYGVTSEERSKMGI